MSDYKFRHFLVYNISNHFFGFSNNVVNKTLINTENSEECKYFNTRSFSVHYLINKVRFWNSNTKFFVTSKIVRHYDIDIRNRLKNIFLQVINDNSIWLGVRQLNLLKIYT